MDEEKKYTVRSAEAELNKLRKVRDRNLEKIRELNAVVKENNESIKELEKIYDRLVSEQLQEEVRTRWFAAATVFPSLQSENFWRSVST